MVRLPQPGKMMFDAYYARPSPCYNRQTTEEDDRPTKMFMRWLSGDGGLLEGGTGVPI